MMPLNIAARRDPAPPSTGEGARRCTSSSRRTPGRSRRSTPSSITIGRGWRATTRAAGSWSRAVATRRPGGVIVLRADSREEVDALLADDPYTEHGLVEYAITAFDETPFPHRSPGFDAFAAQPIADASVPGA